MKKLIEVSVVVNGALVVVLVPSNGRDTNKGTVCITQDEIEAAMIDSEMLEAA